MYRTRWVRVGIAAAQHDFYGRKVRVSIRTFCMNDLITMKLQVKEKTENQKGYEK